jgi:hypothetical protein
MPRSGVWTGGWDPSIHRRWHLTFHLKMGALRPPVVTFAERAGSWLGVGLSPKMSPFWAFSAEVLLLSTSVASSGCRPQSGGALSESSNEVMMSLILFCPVSKVPDIQTYRHKLYIQTWLAVLLGSMAFFLSATAFEFFMNIWG